ncbi:MAG TPA: D-glycero-beta-D-manno-heptose 1-phosphate adenylyltransferase [Acidobacteriota bacterium]|nr:D-glycero-beta-D-manno-heptose 1-phosphate adenylyltransferase [Acidobacteriota bacterium]
MHSSRTAPETENKIIPRRLLASRVSELKAEGKRIVFTNGCFDLLHPGHIRLLARARKLGDILIVALNSDESVRRLKGTNRPILTLSERLEVISALASVDLVTSFEEDTPKEIVDEVIPDVLVKGGDWALDQIVGRETVESNGGQVIAIDFEEGYSTSGIINRIRERAESKLDH